MSRLRDKLWVVWSSQQHRQFRSSAMGKWVFLFNQILSRALFSFTFLTHLTTFGGYDNQLFINGLPLCNRERFGVNRERFGVNREFCGAEPREIQGQSASFAGQNRERFGVSASFSG